MLNNKTQKKGKFLSKEIIWFLPIIIFSTFLITLSAKTKVPFYPVPMTMQTFVIMAIGMIAGGRMGALIVLSYLFEGLAGLPVFAGTPEKGIGLSYILGPTGGYLIGYMFTAYLSGNVKNEDKNITKIIKLIIAIVPTYFFGVIWLGSTLGWSMSIVEMGVIPFLLAEAFKIALLVIISPFIFKLKKYTRS
jgi:biotin transport system substrate-specific component